MTTNVDELLSYATTALAAYADGARRLQPDLYQRSLSDQGMAAAQAGAFVNQFRVLAYFNDSIGSASAGTDGLGQGVRIPTSVSATVFQRISSGERILAIRGTVPSDPGDLWADLRDIFLYRSVGQQSQYAALSRKVTAWIADGTLTSGFTVTGHSLGGFLALELAVERSSNISHAYLFNAPSLGGFQVSGRSMTFNDWLATVYPTRPAFDNSKITNVTAQGGSSLIATLGVSVGDRIDIAIETQRLASIDPVELVHSHAIPTLTDALAVYDLLATVDPAISILDSTKIIEAASSNNRESLERVVSTLALVFGTTALAAVENRDQLFEKIFQLKNTLTASPAAGGYHIIPLSDKTAVQIAGLAQSDIAVRYALQKLDPFAVSGKNELFASFNERGQLDLANNDASSGTLTREWLADRAELLVAQGVVNTFEDGNTIHRQFGSSQDFVVIQPGLDPQVIRIVGPQGVAPPINTPQIIFGTDQADTLRGLDAADHLYGGFGDDRISGGRGSDYLEGGPGNDELQGDPGNDRLAGGAGNDTLDGGSGNNRLEGGAGADTYIARRGAEPSVIEDSDGQGRILLDGAALTGGAGIRPGEYRSSDGGVDYAFSGSLDAQGTLVIGGELEVLDFRNGDLGITLTARDAPGAPEAGGSRLYLDAAYDLENRVKTSDSSDPPRDPFGSADDDTFQAGTQFGAFFFGYAGDDLIGGGGTGSAFLLGGAGDDVIVNRDIPPDPDLDPASRNTLAGEAGRDYLLGSSADESIFGDFNLIVIRPAGLALEGYIDAFHIYGVPEAQATGYYDAELRPVQDYVGDLSRTYPGGIAQALESFIGFSADSLPADAYDDFIDAGAGDDAVAGGPGSDQIYGGEGNDRLFGDSPPNGTGIAYRNDISDPRFEAYLAFFGQPGDDAIDGGPGDDFIYDVGGQSSVAIGGAGDDIIMAHLLDTPSAAIDKSILVDGGDGDDIIETKAPGGFISVEAGAGDDEITAYGDVVFVDGGTGDDRYEVRGIDITIHEDDPVTGNLDSLTILGMREDFDFSRDGDDLVLNSWFDLADEDRIGPDGEFWIGATLRIEDWFAGARHQIEEIVFAPDSGEETVWAPDDIAAALDAGGLAWADFIEPDVPEFQPVALSALPPATVPPPAPTDPPPALPEPAPAAENDAPVITPVPNPNVSQLHPVPVHIEITDPGFNGSLRGTASADVFTVLSERGVVIDAGDGDDQITTGGGSDEVRPGPGNDVVSTGGGDDRVIIDRFEGDKRIDAGPGIDILSIDRSISSISGHVEDGRIVIRDAKDGSLAVTNVNIFELADTVFVLANGESEAIVARLYTMALGRTPDAPGVRYWLDEIAAGRPLADVVHAFSSALYTGTQDEEFLEGFYARAFHRAPDPSEETFWLEQLQTGAVTRDQMITGLAASEEAQLTITGVIPLPGSL